MIQWKKEKVISVEPGEGTEVDEGSEVTIVVSLGSQPATVPSIEGKSQSEAESALAAAGLQGSASEEYSDSVAAGIVISQERHPESRYQRSNGQLCGK